MLDKFKLYLESIKITPISWLLGVSGVLMVRFFLESLSSKTSSGFFASDASTLLHYYLFFMSGLLMLIIFLQVSIPKWKKVVPRFVALLSPVIFIPPIIDWVVSGGRGVKMTYFFDNFNKIFQSFINFGYDEATLGIRIEIALCLIGLGILIYLIQKSWKRAVVAPVFLYAILIIFASIPSVISVIGQVGQLIPVEPISFIKKSIVESSTIANNIHSSLQYSSSIRLFEISFNFMMGKILFLTMTILASFWFFINFRKKFKAVAKNSRIERIAHYILTIILGILVAYLIFPTIRLNWNDWLSVIMLCASFFFSCLFAICINDMADEDIDKISNPTRPLITGDLSREDMKQLAFVFVASSLIAGFLAGYTSFFFILAFTSLYYIYSAPPTRFKLIPFFSSFIIGLCYLTAMLSGFFLVSPVKNVSAFPPKLVVATVIIIFLLSHARDMKDMEGDRSAGIKTVLVLFGPVWGPRVVGFLAGVSFLLIPIFAGVPILFLSAIPAGVVSYYFINKKPYKEKPVVKTYFFFVLGSLLLIIFL